MDQRYNQAPECMILVKKEADNYRYYRIRNKLKIKRTNMSSTIKHSPLNRRSAGCTNNPRLS
eukprot:COSAG02_NODE_29409_length_569_cov_1.700000_1_plen_61_part_01